MLEAALRFVTRSIQDLGVPRRCDGQSRDGDRQEFSRVDGEKSKARSSFKLIVNANSLNFASCSRQTLVEP